MTANDELSQCWSVYYEILINGASQGIFGHDAVRNMHLSVGFSLGTQDVFASAVCEENGELYSYDWLQHAVEGARQGRVSPRWFREISTASSKEAHEPGPVAIIEPPFSTFLRSAGEVFRAQRIDQSQENGMRIAVTLNGVAMHVAGTDVDLGRDAHY